MGWIFESDVTLMLYALLSLIGCMCMQFHLCLGVRRKHVRRIPAYVILAVGVLIVLLALGVFGRGSDGFIENGHLFGAVIIAMLAAPPSLGIGIGWIVYRIHTHKSH